MERDNDSGLETLGYYATTTNNTGVVAEDYNEYNKEDDRLGDLKSQEIVSYNSTKPVRVVIYRTSATGAAGDNRPPSSNEYTRVVNKSYRSSQDHVSPRAGHLISDPMEISAAVVEARDRERREMKDLNEKLAGYIEKVRFLEAQNRKLAKELEDLKQRWGRETKRLKVMYECELSGARKLRNDLEKDKADSEIKVTSMEEQLLEALKRVQDLEAAMKEEREVTTSYCNRIADLESFNSYLKRKLLNLEAEREQSIMRISQLIKQLEKTKVDLDNETLLHIDAENRRQTLGEEIVFMKMIHDQEMKELAGLAYRDSTAENREYWRNEIENALKEIRQLYDDQLGSIRDDIESSYNWKIQEYTTGMNQINMDSMNSRGEVERFKDYLNEINCRLLGAEDKNQMLIKEVESLRRQREGHAIDSDAEIQRLMQDNARLKAELAALLKELNSTADDKLALRKELEDYKKIVEKTPGGSKDIFEHQATVSSQEHLKQACNVQKDKVDRKEDTATETVSKDIQSTVIGEISSKVTIQKSSKGPISITECDEAGKFVTIENLGFREDVDGWHVERVVDDLPPIRYHFKDTILKSKIKLKIWSKDGAPSTTSPNDLIFNRGSWGVGTRSTTTLYNSKGEERANYIQKTKYT